LDAWQAIVPPPINRKEQVMKRKILIPALLMAAGVATAGGLAYGQQSGSAQNDAIVDLAKAKISLAQAIVTAEQHAGGRASRAELENENGRLVYDVEVADNTRTTDVKVDATDGSVVSAQADRADDHSKNGQEERDDD
jgi:uncharacterized membrane protein YkoI